MTVAAFMDLALYDPEFGYYARAAQRSGRAGDFFTSVDVGPLFGELLEVQIAEMFEILGSGHIGPPLPRHDVKVDPRVGPPLQLHDVGADLRVGPFDLVEAGAGNGRLSADLLCAARRRDPACYDSIRLHLVEASAAARAVHASTLADVADRLCSSSPTLPDSFEGVLLANELLDAMPVHQVVMGEDGLREMYVAHEAWISHESTKTRNKGSGFVLSRFRGGSGSLRVIEGPASTPALAAYLDRLGITLEPGWRAEINLRAIEWVHDAARRLRRGFIVIIDYGHEARELYSVTHAGGTLTAYAGHRSGGPESASGDSPWLSNPGEQDLTTHVDFTSVRAAAEAEGMITIGYLDQTYFLVGLLQAISDPQSAIRNPQFKTLIMPGGLGSTHKVLLLGKGVGRPSLKGCSFKVRVT